MEYPLAHDDSGSPIDVPANAAGWLVRRHGGGRGRPAAVYDGDGRPLVVPLESTTAELRSHGCKAGMYRLDAVDASRRVLDVVAYTEVAYDAATDEVESVRSTGGPDAAVAALARAVEAMQRVQAERERAQAERERVQAEMISRLVDRLAPPAPQVPRNLRDALGEYTDVQKIIRKLTPDTDDGDDSSDAFSQITEVVQQAVGLATLYVQQKFGIGVPAADATAEKQKGDEKASESAKADGASEQPPDNAAAQASDGEGPQGKRAAPSEAEVAAKMEAVFALLTDEEAAQVRALSKQVPRPVLEQVLAKLLTMTAEEAVAEIRRQVLGRVPKNGANGRATGRAAQAAS